MLVTCVANTGKDLSPKYRTGGTTENSTFDVSIGGDYTVFAIALWKSQVLLLLADERELPNWYPVELFSVKDPRLPSDWIFGAFRTHEHDVEAIWGYEHLVRDSTHWEALLERDPKALRVFLQEKHNKESLP
jgi:hypothetical protein